MLERPPDLLKTTTTKRGEDRGSIRLAKYNTHGRDEGERGKHQCNNQAQYARADTVASRHKFSVRKRRAITRSVTQRPRTTTPAAKLRLSTRILPQARSALHQRAINPIKQCDAADDARAGGKAIDERGPG